MMQLKSIKLMLLAVFTILSVAVVPVQPVAAASKCNSGFLTFPAWYDGLTKSYPNCELKSPSELNGVAKDKQLSRYITIIALNVLEILIQLVAYIAIGFIIWGGFMYITKGNSSDGITAARKMIQNAVIGLIISLFAVFVVSFVSGRIGI